MPNQNLSNLAGNSRVPPRTKRPLRFLIVDDNPQDRRLVVRELRSAYPDSSILEAIDQTQLDEHIRANDFDVVVTDYELRWSDGIQVLKTIKARQPNCPVIMFTGTGSEEVAVEAMKQGLDDYIIKDVKHLIRLRGAVHSALEHAFTRSRANQLALHLDSLLSQLNFGVFTCSLDGHFLNMNSAMMQLLESENAISTYRHSLASLISSEKKCAEFLRRIRSSTDAQELEIEHPATTAKSKVFRLTARRIELVGEEPCIDGLIQDVSRQKQAEQDAQLAAVAIAQIEMLSPREKEVLDIVVVGLPNKVIAKRMFITEKTVEKHRSNLMKKLRMQSVPELVRLVMCANSGLDTRDNPQ